MAISNGMSTSGPRVTLSPKTAHPPASKVIGNKMNVNMKVPTGNKHGCYSDYGKSGGERDKVDMNPKAAKPGGL